MKLEFDEPIPWRDENEFEISEEEARALFLDHDRRRIVLTNETDSDTAVSTVLLLPPSIQDGKVMYFETMVFSSTHPLAFRCWRYETRAEAVEGHKEVCGVVFDGG